MKALHLYTRPRANSNEKTKHASDVSNATYRLFNVVPVKISIRATRNYFHGKSIFSHASLSRFHRLKFQRIRTRLLSRYFGNVRKVAIVSLSSSRISLRPQGKGEARHAYSPRNSIGLPNEPSRHFYSQLRGDASRRHGHEQKAARVPREQEETSQPLRLRFPHPFLPPCGSPTSFVPLWCRVGAFVKRDTTDAGCLADRFSIARTRQEEARTAKRKRGASRL